MGVNIKGLSRSLLGFHPHPSRSKNERVDDEYVVGVLSCGMGLEIGDSFMNDT